MSRRMTLVLAGVLIVVLATAAAFVLLRRSSADQDEAGGEGVTSHPGASLAEQCPSYRGPATRMVFPSAEDGLALSGASTGKPSAAVAVIIRPGASSAICQWLPWADTIASETSSRVIVFDRRGVGASGGSFDPAHEPGDIRGAVALARQEGARQIALVGSSLGTTSVQSALPALGTTPCATLLVSPITAALAALPPNTWIVWEGQGKRVDEAARTLASRTATPADVHTLTVDTTHHSGGLIRQHPEVLPFMVKAVASCAATT